MLPHPEKDLESSSSKCLEARFPYHDSRAMTRSPSPHASRPDFPGNQKHHPQTHSRSKGHETSQAYTCTREASARGEAASTITPQASRRQRMPRERRAPRHAMPSYPHFPQQVSHDVEG